MLLLAGGLTALQQVTIIAAFPFMLVMIGMCWSLVVELRKEPRTPKDPDAGVVGEGTSLAVPVTGRDGANGATSDSSLRAPAQHRADAGGD